MKKIANMPLLIMRLKREINKEYNENFVPEVFEVVATITTEQITITVSFLEKFRNSNEGLKWWYSLEYKKREELLNYYSGSPYETFTAIVGDSFEEILKDAKKASEKLNNIFGEITKTHKENEKLF